MHGQCPEFTPANVGGVTGATGIAEGVILTLLKNKLSVAACDIKQTALDALIVKAQELGLSEHLHVMKADLCNYEDRVEFIDFAKKIGPIVKLFNIAGVQNIFRFHEFPWEKVTMMNELMTLAPFHLSQMVLAESEKNKSTMPFFEGRRVRIVIVNISSIHSTTIPPLKSVYGFVKGVLDQITNAINSEGPEYGARAVSVRPGYVKIGLVIDQIGKTAKGGGITEEEVVTDVMMKHCRTNEMMRVVTVARHIVHASSALCADLMGKYTIDNGFGTTYR